MSDWITIAVIAIAILSPHFLFTRAGVYGGIITAK
ncbi:hypothetical protein ABIC37_001251 [Priestia megaterium]|jgi:hypothetical protein